MKQKVTVIFAVLLVFSLFFTLPSLALETEPDLDSVNVNASACPHAHITTETVNIRQNCHETLHQTTRTCQMCGQRWVTSIMIDKTHHAYGSWQGVSCETAGSATGEMGKHHWKATCIECGNVITATSNCDGFTHPQPSYPPDNTRD